MYFINLVLPFGIIKVIVIIANTERNVSINRHTHGTQITHILIALNINKRRENKIR